jgi:hypothetical protein
MPTWSSKREPLLYRLPFLDRKRSATSPMLQAQIFQQGFDWTDKIQATQTILAGQIQALETELQHSEADRAATRPRLQEIAATLGFLERWQAQLAERLARLAF